ncbi:MAG: hypothetical protein QXZ44_02480 [Ferroplasma sp.]
MYNIIKSIIIKKREKNMDSSTGEVQLIESEIELCHGIRFFLLNVKSLQRCIK